MPIKTSDLLEIADQIGTARDFVELVKMAHDRPEFNPVGAAASHVTDLLQGVLDMLSGLINSNPQEAMK